jgi:hypothetical protein
MRPVIYLVKFFICGLENTPLKAGRYEETTDGYSTIGIMNYFSNSPIKSVTTNYLANW